MSWTNSRRMVAIFSAIIVMVICTVSVYRSQVPSQRDYKEIPLPKNYKETPSQRDYKETPSQKDYKETPSQRDYKETPSQRDYKSLPSIPDYDTMPLVKYIKSREKLQSTEWVSLLYNFLQTLNKSVSPHVNMIFGDSKHIHLLENWITAAVRRLKPPLHNLMVLSADYSLCNQLLSWNISLTCIPVPDESLIVVLPNVNTVSWPSALIKRQIVLRLINYWGYDVASYDTDAVLFHNPQVLYNAQPYVDVFSASTKNFPLSVSKKWGFSLCVGVLMLKATPAVEALWSNISALVIDEDWDDQIPLNVAIDNMGVMWNKTTKVDDLCSVKSGWKSKSVINIFVFPQYQICRTCCKPSFSYETLYIAHPPGDHFNLERKEDALKRMKAWFL